MNTINHIQGGGVEANSYLTSSNKSFKNSFFKPIVASSLALLLGSALYGQNISSDCVSSGNCTDITGNITFKFGTENSPDVSYDSGSSTVSFGTNITEVTLKDTEFQNDKFNFPNSTMTIDFGDRTDDSKRKFILEATNDFKGNLTVLAGKGLPNGQETKNSSFVGTFKEKFEGDITLGYSPAIEGNAAGHTNTLTFAKGLKGDLNTTAGINTITITEGNIEGNVFAGADRGAFGKATNTITFNGNNAKITGTITAKPGIYNGGAGSNTITFKKYGSIGSEETSNQDVITAEAATNTITFENSAENGVTIQENASITTNSITGNIVAKKSSGGGHGINTITFKNGVTNTITGNVTANASTNNITFENGTTNTITGTITADTFASGGSGYNNITFENGTTNTITGTITAIGSSTNTITFKGNGTNIITGDILAKPSSGGGSATNAITLSGSGTNTITGNVTASASTNIIILENGTANTLKGNIIADTSSIGGVGTNNIKIIGKGAAAQTEGELSDSALSNISFLAGNIETKHSSSVNNLIFEDSIWIPTNVAEVLSGMQNNGNKTTLANLLEDISSISSGTLTNRGTTNIVLKTLSSVFSASGVTPMFDVNNSGTANIVVQGQINIGANVSYASNTSGSTTFIFANSNNSADDAFGHPSDTDISGNNSTVLGVTYQDGIKLVLKDKSISGGTFLGAYAHYFSNVAEGDGILTLKTDRKLTSSNRSNTQTDTITIKGLALGNISELASSATEAAKTATTTYNYNVTLDSNSAFVGNISLQENSNVTLTMKEGSKLLTDSEYLKINSLTIENTKGVSIGEVLANTFAQSNTIIDIATINPDGSLAANTNGSLNPSTRTDFRLLTIGTSEEGKDKTSGVTGLQGGGALFRVYMNAGAGSNATLGGVKTLTSTSGEAVASQDGTTGQYGHVYSDRILILSGTSTGSGSNTTKVNYIQALADSSTQLESIKYNGGGTETAGNIAVATVKGTDNNKVATFEGATQIQGFDIVGTTLKEVKTDENGKVQSQQGLLTDTNSYTTYFISSMTSQGASLANQLASASALGANYNLYLANMNSLNKRMGELRENANSQGAWVRIFNGMQTSKFALETKSIYTTIQAGYDYAFGFNGANNYLGFAISYINSVSDSKESLDIDNATKALKNSASNGVEFAIYNAYVQDGASKDTNFKNGLYTDSILKFSFLNNKLEMSNQSDTYNINNYAITFSQEVGYRFLLGKAKEFYIDPQAEISLGYLNQSDLKQELGQSFLNGIQDSIFTLRGRIGSNFGYDFKNFTQDKGFNAKIYLGTYFVGDYISGGDVSLTSNLGSKVSLSPLASTTRFVLNLGTNFKIKDAHRIYFDFERSFGGKIITDYQINLGYRYSFGASNYTPYNLSNTQEIKDTNSIKEIEPTKGYYLELLNKQDLSKKESKLLKDLKDLKVKTNNNTKTYLIGPFENEDAALKQKQALQGLLKELNSEGNVIVIE